MKKVKLFLMTLALAFSALASAQDIEVKGCVKDSSTGEGIPFASLHVKGTMVGTSTDLDGMYSISVPADGVLVFSSIGYVDSEVAVGGRAVIDVILSPDTQMLEETIVVAFGTATKESFTGSATVVKSDDIAKVQSTSPARALEGVVAGVQMVTESGAPGSSPKLMIRGASSINAGTDPLYIVDGVPFGSIDGINPADIESMTVLKDAASNALYGARGANGVIMVTTKKAKHTEAVVTVDAKWGINTKALQNYDYITAPGQYYEVYYSALKNYLMNKQGMSDYDAHIAANQYMVAGSDNEAASGLSLGYQVYTVPEGQTFIGSNGKLNPNATLGRVVDYLDQSYYLTPDNWMDETYHSSLRQEYNLSVSGTSGKASVLASFGYLNDQGIVDGADMYRYTARLRADYQAKEWLKIGANFAFSHSNMNNNHTSEGSTASTANVFAIANQIAPIYPLYIRDAMGRIMVDRYGFQMYDYGSGSNAGANRPYLNNSNALQASLLDKTNSVGNSFNGTTYAEIKFLKDFTFNFNVGLNSAESRVSQVYNMYYGQYAPMGGMVYKGHSNGLALNLQQLLNWNHKYGPHNVSVLLGHESYQTTSASVSASKSQLFSMENDELSGAVVDGKNASSSRSSYNNEGYLFRGQYDYMNRIFGSVSYRRDASSRFHPDNRWGNFWSLGGGWIINEEAWFPRAPWIDMLKVKASIGSQGNDSISSYLYSNLFGLGNYGGSLSVSFGQAGNKDITWETNTNINAGVDYEFLRGRISGSVEYFYRKTSDMLFFFSVPASLGYGGYYDNIGDMRNQGIELSANVVIMQTNDFNWSAYMNLTHYTNKVTMLPDENKTSTTTEGYSGFASGNSYVGEGLPLNSFYMQQYAGVDRETGDPMWWKTEADGTKVKTTDYSLATQYICGDPTPDIYGGFGTSVNYRGFDFAVAFTYSVGGLTYDSGYAGYMGSPQTSSLGTNFHKDILNAWTPDNKDTDVPKFQFNEQYTAATSDRFLVNASYLNIQNAQIGYTLPASITSRMHISRLRVYAACDNIWYLSCRRGLDPRQSLTGATNNTMYSPVRTISGGLNITF